MDNKTITLEIGETYAWRLLEFAGWTEGDGSGAEGYRVEDYFPAGRYLGPDIHGIEPLFSA